MESKEMVDQIIKMRNSGKTWPDIAKKLKVSPSYARNIVLRAGRINDITYGFQRMKMEASNDIMVYFDTTVNMDKERAVKAAMSRYLISKEEALKEYDRWRKNFMDSNKI